MLNFIKKIFVWIGQSLQWHLLGQWNLWFFLLLLHLDLFFVLMFYLLLFFIYWLLSLRSFRDIFFILLWFFIWFIEWNLLFNLNKAWSMWIFIVWQYLRLNYTNSWQLNIRKRPLGRFLWSYLRFLLQIDTI